MSRAAGRMRPRIGTFVLALALATAAKGEEADDASSLAPTFEEGDVIRFEQTDRLRGFLPEPFWDNRDFFFYEGMRLEIGPTQRDYSPSPEFTSATEFYRGKARIGPDNSLENWTAGRPFPIDDIDCLSDPQAGVKIMWDFQAIGGDGQAHFFYSYDRPPLDAPDVEIPPQAAATRQVQDRNGRAVHLLRLINLHLVVVGEIVIHLSTDTYRYQQLIVLLVLPAHLPRRLHVQPPARRLRDAAEATQPVLYEARPQVGGLVETLLDPFN